MRCTICYFLLLFVISTYASNVNIGILNGKKPTTVIFSPISGDYWLVTQADSLLISNQDLAHLTYVNGQISVKTLEGEIGVYTSLKMIPVNAGCTFKLKPVIPYSHMREYDDELDVSVQNGHLLLINNVQMDKYVAGVVKYEVGTTASFEYYMVQSIICRTYALSNFRKHEEEGFQLCDKVHCQVFGSRCSEADPKTGLRYTGTKNIIKAAFETTGIVIVDENLELITAPFHSNCGGETANSEDVWMLPKSYLRSVIDTFCLGGRNYRWERKIPERKWIAYLSKKYKYPVDDSSYYTLAVDYYQKYRTPYFANRKNILTKEIRSDWKLRSSFFTIKKNGDQLLFSGKGFGHGVGICQEGAIIMADKGYSFKDILHFYYTDVTIMDVASLRYLLKLGL